MPTLHKIKRRFTNSGDAMTGTVRVTEAGGNSAVRVYFDVNGANKYPTNSIALDSNGTVEFYVRPGREYRLTLVDAAGNIQDVAEGISPVGDGIADAHVVDDPGYQNLAFAATVTPIAAGPVTVVKVGTLTGNITVAAPLKPAIGKMMHFMFAQDGTGSRTITWNAAFSLIAANGAGTASQLGATSFVFNGTKWLQVGGALAFHAP